MPDKKADLNALRNRRVELKDILNTNLLAPGAREQYEKEYEANGKAILAAIGMTAEEAAKDGLPV